MLYNVIWLQPINNQVQGYYSMFITQHPSDKVTTILSGQGYFAVLKMLTWIIVPHWELWCVPFSSRWWGCWVTFWRPLIIIWVCNKCFGRRLSLSFIVGLCRCRTLSLLSFPHIPLPCLTQLSVKHPDFWCGTVLWSHGLNGYVIDLAWDLLFCWYYLYWAPTSDCYLGLSFIHSLLSWSFHLKCTDINIYVCVCNGTLNAFSVH